MQETLIAIKQLTYRKVSNQEWLHQNITSDKNQYSLKVKFLQADRFTISKGDMSVWFVVCIFLTDSIFTLFYVSFIIYISHTEAWINSGLSRKQKRRQRKIRKQNTNKSVRTLLVEVDAHSHFLLTSDLVRRNVEKVIEYLQENAKIKDLLSKVNNETDKNDVTVCVYPICNFEL